MFTKKSKQKTYKFFRNASRRIPNCTKKNRLIEGLETIKLARDIKVNGANLTLTAFGSILRNNKHLGQHVEYILNRFTNDTHQNILKIFYESTYGNIFKDKQEYYNKYFEDTFGSFVKKQALYLVPVAGPVLGPAAKASIEAKDFPRKAAGFIGFCEKTLDTKYASDIICDKLSGIDNNLLKSLLNLRKSYLNLFKDAPTINIANIRNKEFPEYLEYFKNLCSKHNQDLSEYKYLDL